MLLRALLLSAVLASTQCAQAQVLQLVTEDEARLPPFASAPVSRGVTRGPGIKLVSPDTSGKITNPFALKVAFIPHGGSTIDPGSVRVTYLKSPLVDLTDRVKSGIVSDGLEVQRAALPAGMHKIRVSIKDSDGRESSETVTFNVTK